MNREKLEKEAGDYAEKHAFRVPYDGSNRFYDDLDFKASKEGYIAGAEPREKIITKLEEQNKNQEESLRITLLEEERKANRIKDLEKENAEIKAKYLQATDEGTSWAHLKNLEDENKRLLQSCEGATMMYKDLCKAREIIRSLLTYCRNYPQQALEKIQQAEQFLREEEIKENTKAPTPEEIKNRLSNIGEAIGDIALDYIIRLEKENTELSEKLNEQKQYTQFKCSEAVNTIEKLKIFIRKMKRCQNCDKFDYTECKCKVGWCNNFEKWALKEVVFIDLKELDDNGL